ncbi:MAG: Asp-tRNA(Asn)/Glu-tRNA(Gln) amidotransferase subunit GatC [Flavobacteriales bacterium]
MRIDDATIEHIAELAKLRPNEKERSSLREDLNDILLLVEKLKETDIEGVEPLRHLLDESAELRPDEIRDEVEQQEALKNAPQKDSDYIKVPKFVRREEGS